MMPLLQKSKTAARDWLQGIDTALLRTVAAAAALCMLLAHGFAFTNLFPNHDSTVLVFDAQWTMYVLGRWAQNLYFPLVRWQCCWPAPPSGVPSGCPGCGAIWVRRSACAAAWRCINPTSSSRWGCTCCCFCNVHCKAQSGGTGCVRGCAL